MPQVVLLLEHRSLEARGLVIGRPELREAPDRLEGTLRTQQDDLVRSCAEAALLAWRVLRSSDYPGKHKVTAPLRLRYTLTDSRVIPQGSSADLAFFCMLLLDRLNAAWPDDEQPRSMVAATGDLFGTAAQVANGYRNPKLQVRRVGGVTIKIAAALAYFAQNGHSETGRVLVPLDNVEELRAQPALARALDRGVIVPVGHLQDALDALRSLPRLPQRLRDALTQLREPFDGNPFRRLEVFDVQHRAQYFGRDALIQEVLDKLPSNLDERRLPGVLIHGYSGSGKSSLLRAGVLGHVLYAGAAGRRFLPQPRPHDAKLDSGLVWRGVNLAKPSESNWCMSLAQHWQGLLGETNLRANSFEALAQLLEDALSRRAPSHGPHAHWVLALDQMEELVPEAGSADADTLLSGLKGLLVRLQQAGVWVLGTVREDYAGRVMPFLRVVFEHTVKVGELSERQFQDFVSDVIERPCQLAGIAIEPKLLDALKREAHDAKSIPLLQFALDELYRLAHQRRAKSNGGLLQLTLEDYEGLGGIGKAVDAKAHELLARDPLDAAKVVGLLGRMARGAKGSAGHVFGYVRVSVQLDETEGVLIEPWVQERLVVRVGLEAEVAHEALLNHFTVLREWLKRNEVLLQWRQDHLLPPMRQWQSGSPDDQQWLLGERDLPKSMEALGLDNLLGATERDYIERSDRAVRQRRERKAAEERRRHEELRRKNLVLRVAAAILSVLLVVAGGAITAAIRAQRNAEAFALEVTLRQWILEVLNEPEETRVDHANLLKLLLAYQAAPDSAFAKDALVRIANRVRAYPLPRLAERRAHAGGVTCVAFSPDGKYMVSGGVDETLQLWDAEAGHPIGAPMRGHEDSVTSVAISPDGRRVVSGSMDMTLRLWEVPSGRQVGAPFRGHRMGISSVAFSPDGLRVYSGSEDGTLRAWDVSSGREVGVPGIGLYGASRVPIDGVAVLPDGKSVVAIDRSRAVRLWDAGRSGRLRKTLRDSHGKRGDVLFDPGREGAADSVAISSNGRKALFMSSGRMVVFDLVADRALFAIDLRTQPDSADIRAAAFSPNGDAVVSIASSGALRLWDVGSRRGIGGNVFAHRSSQSHPLRPGFWAVAFAPDGKRVASGGPDGRVVLSEVAQPNKVNVGSLRALSIAPDDVNLLVGKYAPSYFAFALKDTKNDATELLGTLEEIASVQPFSDDVVAKFSPDGTKVLFIYQMRKFRDRDTVSVLRVFDVPSRKFTGEQPIEWPSTNAIFSPDSKSILDALGRKWAADTGVESSKRTRICDSFVTSLALSFDGTRVACGHEDGRVTLESTHSNEQRGGRIVGHLSEVEALAFSPDGRRLASGGAGGTLRLWDAALGTPTGGPMQHGEGRIKRVEFSPDSQSIVSTDGETARVWDVKTGSALGDPIQLFEKSVIRFSRDGKWLLIGTNDSLQRWPTVTGSVDWLCHLVARNPTLQELRRWGAGRLPKLPLACPTLE